MSLKWILQVLMQYEIILITSTSITGVTYRDHFDFEERYIDANKCNPFYWYPLHLPAYCAEVIEKEIRSRLESTSPVRITKKREKKKRHHQSTTATYSYSEEISSFPYPLYEITSAEYESYSSPYTELLPVNPYEELIELLKKDFKKVPSSPTVTVIPNLGPVALYKQAISKKSEKKIKAMVKAYDKATKKMYDEYYAAHDNHPSESKLFVYDSAKNNTERENKKKEYEEKKKKEKDKKNKVYRVKSKHGGVVTIIETKNLEIMKKHGFPL